MQDFKESPKTISLFPSGCLADTGRFLPDILPVEANYVTKSCINPHDFNLITCQSPNLQEFINEVGGLQLDQMRNSDWVTVQLLRLKADSQNNDVSNSFCLLLLESCRNPILTVETHSSTNHQMTHLLSVDTQVCIGSWRHII